MTDEEKLQIAIEFIRKCLEHPDGDIREEARKALRAIENEK